MAAPTDTAAGESGGAAALAVGTTTTTAAASSDGEPLRRVAFVTVGATAGFRPLLQEVLSDAFIARLLALGYTRLVVQCGPDDDFAVSCLPREVVPEAPEAETADERALRERRNGFVRDIYVFKYTSRMRMWMRLAGPGIDKEDGGRRGHGVIISHAGMIASSLSSFLLCMYVCIYGPRSLGVLTARVQGPERCWTRWP